jgi:hypothetical protein
MSYEESTLMTLIIEIILLVYMIDLNITENDGSHYNKQCTAQIVEVLLHNRSDLGVSNSQICVQ